MKWCVHACQRRRMSTRRFQIQHVVWNANSCSARTFFFCENAEWKWVLSFIDAYICMTKVKKNSETICILKSRIQASRNEFLRVSFRINVYSCLWGDFNFNCVIKIWKSNAWITIHGICSVKSMTKIDIRTFWNWNIFLLLWRRIMIQCEYKFDLFLDWLFHQSPKIPIQTLATVTVVLRKKPSHSLTHPQTVHNNYMQVWLKLESHKNSQRMEEDDEKMYQKEMGVKEEVSNIRSLSHLIQIL